MEYPKHPQVIDISDNFDFNIEDYFQWLLDNKVVPNPREKYRVSTSAFEFQRASKYLSKTLLLKLRSEGLITIVKKGGKPYVVKDNLWKALTGYLKANTPNQGVNLKHSIAA